VSWPLFASFSIGTSTHEVLVESVGVLAAALAYLFVRRLPSDVLTLGWGVLALGLICDFLDEFASAHPGYDVLEGFFKAGGTTLVAVGFFVSYRTVSEQLLRSKEAERAVAAMEQRFRALFEDAPVGYHEVDPSGTVIRANQEIHRILGYPPGALVGRALRDLLGEEEWPDERNGEEGAAGSGRTELLYRSARGELVPLEIHENAIPGPRGLPHGVRTALLDLRDRKRAEQERHILEVQLLQAQKLETVGTMAGGIAHDFNNLLTPILGHVDLLLADAEDPERREGLLQIRRSTDRARKLVARILTFSRHHGDGGVREAVDMGAILGEAVDFLRSSLPASVELRVEQRDRDLWVAGDPTRLQQVILNLGTNGADAMDRKGTLTLVAERGPPPETARPGGAGAGGGEWVHLSVRDEGAGIPGDVMERIFDPFFTTKPPGHGTGLGLSVAHGIAGDHGGLLTAESEPGMGATFHVWLPAAPPATPSVAPDTPSAGRGDEHILLVDDEEPVRDVLRRLLERLGYRVTALGDPVEALEGVGKPTGAPDLLITDLSMPALSGLELGSRLAARRPEVPQILLTGYAEELTRSQLQAAGFHRVLRKPVDLRELGQAVRAAMDRTLTTERPA
jgi:PAS domain S-box-containing protein